MLMGQFTNNFLTLSTKRESCDLANDRFFLSAKRPLQIICPFVFLSVCSHVRCIYVGMYSIGCDSQLAPRSTSLLSLQKNMLSEGR